MFQHNYDDKPLLSLSNSCIEMMCLMGEVFSMWGGGEKGGGGGGG